MAFRFFLDHFFEPDGRVKYYHDRTYPIDTHALAQAIITLTEMGIRQKGDLALAQRVWDYARRHLRAEGGWFYYQQWPWFTVKIPYMRWAQAWMLVAMACLAEALQAPLPAPGCVETRRSETACGAAALPLDDRS